MSDANERIAELEKENADLRELLRDVRWIVNNLSNTLQIEEQNPNTVWHVGFKFDELKKKIKILEAQNDSLRNQLQGKQLEVDTLKTKVRRANGSWM